MTWILPLSEKSCLHTFSGFSTSLHVTSWASSIHAEHRWSSTWSNLVRATSLLHLPCFSMAFAWWFFSSTIAFWWPCLMIWWSYFYGRCLMVSPDGRWPYSIMRILSCNVRILSYDVQIPSCDMRILSCKFYRANSIVQIPSCKFYCESFFYRTQIPSCEFYRTSSFYCMRTPLHQVFICGTHVATLHLALG